MWIEKNEWVCIYEHSLVRQVITPWTDAKFWFGPHKLSYGLFLHLTLTLSTWWFCHKNEPMFKYI